VKAQAGFALIEAIAVIAIAAACAGALILALSSVPKSGSHATGRNRVAASLFAEQILRVAEDAWKYGSHGDAPSGTFETSIPNPVSVVSTITRNDSSGADISVTVSYTPDPGHDESGSVTLRGKLRAKAPLPGARVEQSGLISAPQNSS
jgi:type II secretory pathway pseudopilin PulG